MSLRIKEPQQSLLASFLEARKEEYGTDNWRKMKAELERFSGDLAAYFKWYDNRKGKEKCDDGKYYSRIPQKTLLLVKGDRYIGRISIRGELNEFLAQDGGHVGYGLRPSERGKGYGTQMLSLLKPELKKLGLNEVLVTTEVDNHPSRRILEKNGWRLDKTVKLPYSENELCHYLLEL